MGWVGGRGRTLSSANPPQVSHGVRRRPLASTGSARPPPCHNRRLHRAEPPAPPARVWQAEVVGLAGAHAPRHARTLLRLFRRLGLRVALSAFDVLQVEVEVPGLKPRVLEADAVAEAGEEGAGGVLLSSVAVPFPARGRGYLSAPPQVFTL